MKKLIIMVIITSTSFMINSVNSQEMKRKKANIKASYEILIDAPIDSVWQALAVDYAGIGKWASGVNHVVESSGYGITAKRYCEISAAGFNDTKERVLKFEPKNYYFEYELYEGLPDFVRYSVNKDRLVEKDGKTLWISKNEMRVGGFMGLTMKWMMKGSLKTVLKNKGEELKHFIETGNPHPRKVEVMQKKEKKDAKMRKKIVSFVIERTIHASADKVWKVIGKDFAHVADSNPICPESSFVEGYTQPELGAKRIMYMSENKKKYFVDRIGKWDPENYDITIEIAEKKGFPINPTYTWVNMTAIPLNSEKTKLVIRMNYLTKPRFLKGLAKGGLKKNFRSYAIAIEHHVLTGEKVDKKTWKRIKKQYQ